MAPILHLAACCALLVGAGRALAPTPVAVAARTFAPATTTRRGAVGLATSALVLGTAGGSARGAEDPRTQWKAAVKELDAIIVEFEDIQGGGDGIRRRLGTVGTSSPLFQIEKVCQKLLPVAEDPGEFAEALEDFMLGIGRVDGMAYSSNFAGGSGKPSENSAATYIARSEKRGRKRVIQRHFNLGVLEAIPERQASTRRGRPER